MVVEIGSLAKEDEISLDEVWIRIVGEENYIVEQFEEEEQK